MADAPSGDNADSRSSGPDGGSNSPAARSLRRDAPLDAEPARLAGKAGLDDVRLADNTPNHDQLKPNAKPTKPRASPGPRAKDGPRKTHQHDPEPLAGDGALLRPPGDSRTARATGDRDGNVDRGRRVAVTANHGFLSSTAPAPARGPSARSSPLPTVSTRLPPSPPPPPLPPPQPALQPFPLDSRLSTQSGSQSSPRSLGLNTNKNTNNSNSSRSNSNNSNNSSSNSNASPTQRNGAGSRGLVRRPSPVAVTLTSSPPPPQVAPSSSPGIPVTATRACITSSASMRAPSTPQYSGVSQSRPIFEPMPVPLHPVPVGARLQHGRYSATTAGPNSRRGPTVPAASQTQSQLASNAAGDSINQVEEPGRTMPVPSSASSSSNLSNLSGSPSASQQLPAQSNTKPSPPRIETKEEPPGSPVPLKSRADRWSERVSNIGEASSSQARGDGVAKPSMGGDPGPSVISAQAQDAIDGHNSIGDPSGEAAFVAPNSAARFVGPGTNLAQAGLDGYGAANHQPLWPQHQQGVFYPGEYMDGSGPRQYVSSVEMMNAGSGPPLGWFVGHPAHQPIAHPLTTWAGYPQHQASGGWAPVPGGVLHHGWTMYPVRPRAFSEATGVAYMPQRGDAGVQPVHHGGPNQSQRSPQTNLFPNHGHDSLEQQQHQQQPQLVQHAPLMAPPQFAPSMPSPAPSARSNSLSDGIGVRTASDPTVSGRSIVNADLGPRLGRASSHFRGVSWHKRDRRWMARSWSGKKSTHLGTYQHEDVAAIAVDIYEHAHGKPEPELNFPVLLSRHYALLAFSSHPGFRQDWATLRAHVPKHDLQRELERSETILGQATQWQQQQQRLLDHQHQHQQQQQSEAQWQQREKQSLGRESKANRGEDGESDERAQRQQTGEMAMDRIDGHDVDGELDADQTKRKSSPRRRGSLLDSSSRRRRGSATHRDGATTTRRRQRKSPDQAGQAHHSSRRRESDEGHHRSRADDPSPSPSERRRRSSSKLVRSRIEHQQQLDQVHRLQHQHLETQQQQQTAAGPSSSRGQLEVSEQPSEAAKVRDGRRKPKRRQSLPSDHDEELEHRHGQEVEAEEHEQRDHHFHHQHQHQQQTHEQQEHHHHHHQQQQQLRHRRHNRQREPHQARPQTQPPNSRALSPPLAADEEGLVEQHDESSEDQPKQPNVKRKALSESSTESETRAKLVPASKVARDGPAPAPSVGQQPPRSDELSSGSWSMEHALSTPPPLTPGPVRTPGSETRATSLDHDGLRRGRSDADGIEHDGFAAWQPSPASVSGSRLGSLSASSSSRRASPRAGGQRRPRAASEQSSPAGLNLSRFSGLGGAGSPGKDGDLLHGVVFDSPQLGSASSSGAASPLPGGAGRGAGGDGAFPPALEPSADDLLLAAFDSAGSGGSDADDQRA